MVVIRAVVFDLDGVLLDSEHVWDAARRDVAARHGGTWRVGATEAMLGMSSPEWSAYMHDVVGVPLTPEHINGAVVEQVLDRYRHDLPLVAGAREAVRRLGARMPLALASSSNRVVIETVLSAAGLAGWFAATVSSEEVAHGKPQPDVYVEAARRLGEAPDRCAAVEDSANGIRSAKAAGLVVVAVPNPHFPPPPDVLSGADAVLDDLATLTPALVERLGGRTPAGAGPGEPGTASARDEAIDEEERESFPASDPHSEWAGPPG
jgi:HAD superfamily hydrolase (TIGR01509 family)